MEGVVGESGLGGYCARTGERDRPQVGPFFFFFSEYITFSNILRLIFFVVHGLGCRRGHTRESKSSAIRFFLLRKWRVYR